MADVVGSAHNIKADPARVQQDRPDDDPIFIFTFDQIPQKIRDAEQYYDKLDYDASTGILVSCIRLYDEQYGEQWAIKELEKDTPLSQSERFIPTLQFARLLKEYALNLMAFAQERDTLTAAHATPTSAGGEEEGGENGTPSTTVTGDDGDDIDSDDDDEDEDAEKEESYYSIAVENFQLAYQIFTKYILESSNETVLDKDIAISKDITQADGSTITVRWAIGNTSSFPLPASDLLEDYWTGKIDLNRVEVCQVYLADVYEGLADIHCEEEQWIDAAHYLDLSLRIRQKTEKTYGRGLASVHSKYAAFYHAQQQYESSNEHYILSASVFVNRMNEKVQSLYTYLQHCNINEKIPLPQWNLSTGTDNSLLRISPEECNNVVTFFTSKLFPYVDQLYGGDIRNKSSKEISSAIYNILDYIDIYKAIYARYEDNLQDIADCKKREAEAAAEGSTTTSTTSTTDNNDTNTSTYDDTKRVKAMVQEVMRTDQLVNNKSLGIEESLGFGQSYVSSPPSIDGTSTDNADVNVLTVKRRPRPATGTTTTNATNTPTTTATGSDTVSNQGNLLGGNLSAFDTTNNDNGHEDEGFFPQAKKAKIFE